MDSLRGAHHLVQGPAQLCALFSVLVQSKPKAILGQDWTQQRTPQPPGMDAAFAIGERASRGCSALPPSLCLSLGALIYAFYCKRYFPSWHQNHLTFRMHH